MKTIKIKNSCGNGGGCIITQMPIFIKIIKTKSIKKAA